MNANIANKTETQQNHDTENKEGVVMDKDAAREALKALAGSADRSKMAKLRELYDDIRQAQKAGVANEQILETLNEKDKDLKLNLKSFETMMYRLRREKGETRSQKRPAAPAPQSGSGAGSTREASAPSPVVNSAAGKEPLITTQPLDSHAVLGDLAKPEGSNFSPLPKASTFEIDESERGNKK